MIAKSELGPEEKSHQTSSNASPGAHSSSQYFSLLEETSMNKKGSILSFVFSVVLTK